MHDSPGRHRVPRLLAVVCRAFAGDGAHARAVDVLQTCLAHGEAEVLAFFRPVELGRAGGGKDVGRVARQRLAQPVGYCNHIGVHDALPVRREEFRGVARPRHDTLASKADWAVATHW